MMKRSVMCLLVVLPLACVSSCAIKRSAPNSCSTLDIIYVDNDLGVEGIREGIFSVTNTGRISVKLPLQWGSGRHIDRQYATPEERSSSNGGWRVFNPTLEEVAGWNALLIVKPGQTKKISYHANGLFDESVPANDMEYSIVVRDLAGCAYRSIPFTNKGDFKGP